MPPNSGAWRASGCREIPSGWNESTGPFSANTSRNSKRSCEPRKSPCYAVTACSAAPPGTVLKSSSTTTSRSLVAQRVGRLPEHQRPAAEVPRSRRQTDRPSSPGRRKGDIHDSSWQAWMSPSLAPAVAPRPRVHAGRLRVGGAVVAGGVEHLQRLVALPVRPVRGSRRGE